MIKVIKCFMLIIAFIIIPSLFIYKAYQINEQREDNMKNIYLSIMNAPVLVANEKTFMNSPDLQQKMQIIEKIGQMQNYSLLMMNTIKNNDNKYDIYNGRLLNIYYNYNMYANRLQNESKIDKYTSIQYLDKIMKAYHIDPNNYKKNTPVDNNIIAWILIVYLVIISLFYAFLIKRKINKI